MSTALSRPSLLPDHAPLPRPHLAAISKVYLVDHNKGDYTGLTHQNNIIKLTDIVCRGGGGSQWVRGGGQRGRGQRGVEGAQIGFGAHWDILQELCGEGINVSVISNNI